MSNSKPPEKILMVDDEVQLLDSFRRELRGKINLDTALGGEEALKAIAESGPYAVVVTDFIMPGMNGIEFLAQVRKVAPDTVRMMLTGYADMENTIQAVNQGNIFRFLTKPCDTITLIRALVDGIRQYRLGRTEKDLLDQTLRGSIKVLSDLLALVKPLALGRASRITHYIKEIALVFEEDWGWEYETAALLSQIGCITLPDGLIRKVSHGRPLSRQDEKIYLQHPQIGADMVSKIPRMDEVARIIAYQEKYFDGSGVPEDEVREEDIPMGARLIKTLLDFDALVTGGASKGKALAKLKEKTGLYDPAIITALDLVLGVEAKYDIIEIGVFGMEEGMILAEDIMTKALDRRLLSKGQELSDTLIMSILSHSRIEGIREPIKVIIPLKK